MKNYFSLSMRPQDIGQISALGLAHCGDAVFDELAQYKRGRNAHVSAIPKNATHEQYSKATGLECLFGALYLAGKLERINELFILTMEEPHAD